MKTLCPTFIIGSIQIGTIQDASCVNFGNNFPMDFLSQKKQNQGFGNISGDHNDIHEILSRLTEHDTTETFNSSSNGAETEWLNKIMNSIEEEEVDRE